MNIRMKAMFPLLAMVAVATAADATAVSGRTRFNIPASHCAVKPLSGGGATPGNIIYGTFLINNTGATQEFQCPITASGGSWTSLYAGVHVSPGWATSSSCQLCTGDGDGNLWCYAPSYISHPSPYRDFVAWDGGAAIGYSQNPGEIQCGLPNGQALRAYYIDNFINLY